MTMVDNDKSVMSLFSLQAIAAGDSVYSARMDIRLKRGYFSAQFKITGIGTGKVEFEVSNRENPSVNADWSAPSDAGISGVIATGLTAATYLYAVNPPPAKWIRFKITETGAANPITVDDFDFFAQDHWVRGL